MSIESHKHDDKPSSSDSHREDALISASGSLAAWFLKENKEKGRSLSIPKLGIKINADGSVDEIDKSE